MAAVLDGGRPEAAWRAADAVRCDGVVALACFRACCACGAGVLRCCAAAFALAQVVDGLGTSGVMGVIPEALTPREVSGCSAEPAFEGVWEGGEARGGRRRGVAAVTPCSVVCSGGALGARCSLRQALHGSPLEPASSLVVIARLKFGRHEWWGGGMRVCRERRARAPRTRNQALWKSG